MIRKKLITLVRALTGLDRPAARPTDNASAPLSATG